MSANATSRPRRLALLACGWCNLGLGMVGAVLPGMPTTVFLLIALWAFSKSSPRLERWLYEHPSFGPGLTLWRDHRVVPPRAKVLAVLLMVTSVAMVAYASETRAAPLLLGAFLTLIATWLVTRPSRPAGRS